MAINKRKYVFFRQIEIQSMVWLGVIAVFIFNYLPIYGIIIAFKDYNVLTGFYESQWVGFKYFKEFLTDFFLLRAIRNTLGINVLALLIGFPLTIIFALLLNELSIIFYKRFVQTASYLPHFISWVVFGGMVIKFLQMSSGGILNDILISLGFISQRINFIGKPEYFWYIYIICSILKELGWGAIIYIAAIAGVDPQLYDAARIDGASRLQNAIYVTLPCISGTVMIMLIFRISAMLSTGFDSIYVLQNPLNISMSETIDTYIYKIGLKQFRFSYATAAGLSRSLIAMLLLVLANVFSKRATGKGLF